VVSGTLQVAYYCAKIQDELPNFRDIVIHTHSMVMEKNK